MFDVVGKSLGHLHPVSDSLGSNLSSVPWGQMLSEVAVSLLPLWEMWVHSLVPGFCITQNRLFGE